MSSPVTLQKWFSAWDPFALVQTIDSCKRHIANAGGDIQTARHAIAGLAGGNVSLQCRAHFRPIDDVLKAMQQGAVDQRDLDRMRELEKKARAQRGLNDAEQAEYERLRGIEW